MSDTDAKNAPKAVSQTDDAQTPGPLDLDLPIELREPEKDTAKPEQATQTVMTSAVDNAPEGSAEPGTPRPAKSHDERFAMPPSFEERFILTYEANRQELFRSYDDKRPAISDGGDILKTRNADRSTAMDMIELVTHRGWSSMKVKGPEEFRREMWIEGTAQGIEVKGYRPNDKDRGEAGRRAELIGDRVIERTDQGRSSTGRQSENGRQQETLTKGASNVVPMVDYQKGLDGNITGIGSAPYRDREGASSTPFVALELADGRAHKLWGVGLPDMIDKNQLKVGDRATIYDDGKKAVTIKERDPKTGEEHDKQTFRREWGARDITRAPGREETRIEPVQKRDETVIEPTPQIAQGKGAVSEPNNSEKPRQPEQDQNSDRLEERLNRKDAAGDPLLRGATSILARLEAEMRAADVSEKDRATLRGLATHELANGLREGRLYDVQRLANVTVSQQMAAKSLSSKDVSKIIEKARVQTPPKIDATNKNPAQITEQLRERAQQKDHRRDR